MSYSNQIQKFRALAISLSLAAVALAAAAQTATAGQYSVHACDADGQVVENASWVVDAGSDAGFKVSADCPSLSASGVQTATGVIPYDGFGALTFAAPAGTSIDSYRLTGQAVVEDPGLEKYDAGVLASGGESSSLIGCEFQSICLAVFGKPYDFIAAPANTQKLQLIVSCRTLIGCNVWSGAGGEQASVAASRTEVVLRDDSAPTVLASGTLSGGGTIGDILSADFEASDVGGGVASVALEIDGRIEDSVAPGGACAEPFVERQPCPTDSAGQLQLDTAGIDGGPHTWEITATDAAGNVGSSGVGAFYLSSPPASPLPPVDTPTNGVPAVNDPVVRFDKKLNKVRTGSTTISGRVLTKSGQPVVGATIVLQTLDIGVYDSDEKSGGTVVTDADGRFSVKVRADGAKRVTAFFSPFSGAAPTAMFSTIVRQELSLTAKASPRVVKPRGTVAISGRLSGAGDAAKDAPVEIQAVIRGKWRAIGVEEARSSGSYRWEYEFVNVRRNADFRFRAVVRRNAAWPWPSEFTSPVKVSIRR